MTRTSGDLALYRRLWQQARPHAPRIAGLLLIGLLASPLALLTPLPLTIAVDSGLDTQPLPGFLDTALPDLLSGSQSGAVAVAAALALLVALFSQLHALATRYLRAQVGESLILRFRAQLFHHVQRLSLTYHDASGTADSLYRIQKDAPALQHIVIDGFLPLVTSLFTIGAMIYVTARIDAVLALVAIAITPPLFLVLRTYRRRLRGQSREVKKLESAALAVVQEVLGALRVVRSFGQEPREERRFRQRAGLGMRARLRLALAEGRFSVLVGLIAAAGTAGVLVLGVQHVHAGVLTVGELLLIMGYVTQLYQPVKTISKNVATMQGHLASAERAFDLLDEACDVTERPDARTLERARGRVSFERVSFRYGPERPVLHEVSFTVEPGTTLGIEGTTGAGKSTLISLLTRLYDPTSGRVLLDDLDLRDYRLADLRRQFAVVLQDPVLFATTVAENIAYARPGATRDQVVAAAQAANAHEFIVRLPQGYDTPVGDRGVQLSGGQRQRVALARACLGDTPVLILDEPTSAVDQTTEAAIVDALERLKRGRTVIIISHRPSTLAACEATMRLEDGRVVTQPRSPGRPASREEKRRENLLAHPAVQAWRRLRPDGALPNRVAPTKLKPYQRRTPVYRLEGAGPGAAAVIAKRCAAGNVEVELLVYRSFLARFSIAAASCYGQVEEPGGAYTWLFLGEVPGEEYSTANAQHREYAGRWLAALHLGAHFQGPHRGLPQAGPERYLDQLRAARALIQVHWDNPALGGNDLGYLEDLVSRLDRLEEDWALLVDACEGIPQTLVHGDLSVKNVRVQTSPPGIAVFDWEDAGWGVPAVDLAQLANPKSRIALGPDLDAYWEAVRRHWPIAGRAELERLAWCGSVCRAVACLQWDAHHLEHEWAGAFVDSMRLYDAELRHALAQLEGVRPAPRAGVSG